MIGVTLCLYMLRRFQATITAKLCWAQVLNGWVEELKGVKTTAGARGVVKRPHEGALSWRSDVILSLYLSLSPYRSTNHQGPIQAYEVPLHRRHQRLPLYNKLHNIPICPELSQHLPTNTPAACELDSHPMSLTLAKHSLRELSLAARHILNLAQWQER